MTKYQIFSVFLLCLSLAFGTFPDPPSLPNLGFPTIGGGSDSGSGSGLGFRTRPGRAYTYAPNMDIRINSNGRNILIPKEPAGYLDTAPKPMVPVYRAEADPNKRLSIGQGVPIATNKKGQEKMLFASVGGNPSRTEDFMQQSRYRETQSQIGKGNRPSNMFDASGQTIRYGQISPGLARKVIFSSVPERLNTVSQTQSKIGMNSNVKNVDVTKSYNQFGIGGNTLTQVRNELNQNGIRQGTTFFDRRRSSPAVLTSLNGNAFGATTGNRGSASGMGSKSGSTVRGARGSSTSRQG